MRTANLFATPTAATTTGSTTATACWPVVRRLTITLWKLRTPTMLNEELLVIVGLCTHLGCAPKFRPEVGAADMGGDEWLGGFFCPCHGSKFDLAGRVYKGVPASANLEVPPYSFEGENVLVIGVDAEAV